MPHPAAGLAEDIARVRHAQDREHDRLGRGPTLAEQREMADLAARHRELFADLELSLPQPRGEHRPTDYHVELLSRLQPFSPTFRNTSLDRLTGARGFDAIAGEIVRDARRIATDKTVGSFKRPGALRAVHRTDAAGQTSTDYYGSPLSWMQAFMSPVVAKVEAFVDPATGQHICR